VTKANNRETIAAQLASADEEVRLAGVRSLAGGDAEACLDQLFQGFGDPSWRVRKEAADLFLRLPVSPGMIGEIIELLHAEDNAGLRNTAVDILVRMGRQAVPMLLENIRCPDHDVRKFIIDILGEIADPCVIPELRQALVDEDGNVRAAAAENLGKLRAAAAVPALLDAMHYPDVLLRFTILEALGKIGVAVPLERLLPFHEEKLLRKALIDCLGMVGDQSCAAELLAGLTDPMRNVRDASLQALVALVERYPEEVCALLSSQDVPSTVTALLDYLEDSQSVALCLAAVRVLGWLATPRAVLPLLGKLADEALQDHALSALLRIARRDPHPVLGAWSLCTPLQRAYLAFVFGEAGCTESVPLLRAALAEDDPRQVQMAAHALGRLGGAAELVPLAAALCHADADVRDATAQALGSLGCRFPTELLAALEPLLTATDATVRSAAVSVLGRLDAAVVASRLAMALKDPAVEVRRAALKALGGTAAAGHLLAIQLALSDEDVEVRRITAEILGSCGSQEAVQGLSLALSDENLWVRAAAVRSLGEVGGEAAAGAIAALLDDPVGLVQIVALETLATLLGDQACPQICAALDRHDQEVVSVALDLLARHATPARLTAQAEALVNHPASNVRNRCAQLLAELVGEPARSSLEGRLRVETDAIVRQQFETALRLLDR